MIKYHYFYLPVIMGFLVLFIYKFGMDSFANHSYTTEDVAATMDPTPQIDPTPQTPLLSENYATQGMTAAAPENYELYEHFFQTLHQLEKGNPDKIVIMQFGDSHTAADIFTGELRNRFQQQFGNAGIGFIYPGKFYKSNRHNLVTAKYTRIEKIEPERPAEDEDFLRYTDLVSNRGGLLYNRRSNYPTSDNTISQPISNSEEIEEKETDDWTTYHVMFKNRGANPTNRYGLGGVYSVSHTEGDNFTIRTRYSYYTRMELWYLKQPTGGNFLVNGNTLSSYSSGYSAGRYIQNYNQPQYTVSVELIEDVEVGIFGMVLENHQSGIVLDTLGLNGMTALHLYYTDWESTVANHLSLRNPDLIIVAFGTNEALDETIDVAVYEVYYKQLLQKLQAYTNNKATILVLLPPDLNYKEELEIPVYEDGERTTETVEIWQTPLHLLNIIAAQKKAAREVGCPTINLFEIMGGANSMHAYVESDPQLGNPDHIHFLGEGYQRLATLVYNIIMEEYELYKANSQE
jgi:lysophospholipase L1-like esterase